MKTPLRLLLLEDDPVDADLVAATLSEAGLEFTARRVDTRSDFLAAIETGAFDLILADYSIPGFDGMTALSLARQQAPDIPFLFVSATIGEELAIDAMHHGATDYVLKQRLGRLVPSVQRALRERDERRERQRAEEALAQSERQFRQAQKMEAVGRLAGGIAHDFNNLLTVIMGYSHVLATELGREHPLYTKIEETQKAGERAAMLVRQLLAFSRKQPLEPKHLSLNNVVANLEGMLQRLIGADIRLVITLDPGNSQVRADQAQLEQVLMNLVLNARDAMPNGGTLTIETAQVELAKSPLYHVDPLPPGPYVKLSVADTGSGMDRETQAHIFEPFFTTKEEGKGSGLGLSTVYGIVTQSGGAIDVTSRVEPWHEIRHLLSQGLRRRASGVVPQGLRSAGWRERDHSVGRRRRQRAHFAPGRSAKAWIPGDRGEARFGGVPACVAGAGSAGPVVDRYGDAGNGWSRAGAASDDDQARIADPFYVRLHGRCRHSGRS